MEHPPTRRASVTSLEALVPYALPSTVSTSPFSPSSSSSPHFAPLPLENTPARPSRPNAAPQEPWKGLGRYPAYSAHDDSDLFPTFSSRLAFEGGGGGNGNGKGSWGSGRGKLRKAPPSFERLPGAEGQGKGSGGRSAKERFGSGSGGRRKAPEGRRLSGLGGLACGVVGVGRREVNATMAEKGYGEGWGVESEGEEQKKADKAKSTAARPPPTKRPSLFSRSHISPARTKLDSRTRRLQNKAVLHSSPSGSDSSFVLVQRAEAPAGLEFYRDRHSGGSSDAEEEEEAKTPRVPSARLSDAETTGENALRRRPVLTAHPRFPLQTQPVPVPSNETQPAATKHFKLPTLPSPPIHGCPAVLLPTPAGLTDVSFDLDEGASLLSEGETFLENDHGDVGPFATPTTEEPRGEFSEGTTSFRPVEQENDDAPLSFQRHTANPSAASSTWMDDFLHHYGSSIASSSSDRNAGSVDDAASVASVASEDRPLGEKYPQRMPLLQSLSLDPLSPAVQVSSPRPHLPHPSLSSTTPLPTLSLPASTTPLPSSRSRSPRPPTPLLDLNAPPPSPSWQAYPKPRSPRDGGLIGFVKGKNLPAEVGAKGLRGRG
ncbi:hypothetical protein JCM6882_001477 [Rhodosporidiobolus microsporus]